jgi:HAD superfamily hydrolase (TIGR01450 family)
MALLTSDVPLCEAHDLVMLDLDGVVYVGPHAVDGAAEALEASVRRGARIAYLTNNASRPTATVAEHLRSLGMPVHDDGEVVTSAQAVARLMAGDLATGSRVLVVGGPGLREPLEAAGLVCVDSAEAEPAAVVQGFHPDLGWTQLAEAAYAVAAGAAYYASNLDLSVPTPRGTAPGNGSLVQAVVNATGRHPVVAGKPERPLFEETLRRTGAERPLMVGDRVDTDIDGATAAGLPAMAVLTGVSDLAELAGLAPARRPGYVAHDLRGLVDVHPTVDVSDQEARCGDAVARLEGGSVVLAEGDPRSTASVRAVLGLAWTLVDRGDGPVDVGLGG